MTSPTPEDHRVRSRIDLLSAWIEARMAYSGLPGLSIGVVHDQRLVWARGFGYADVERRAPATPDTLYRIASITKLFTTTAILQLRDAGRLRLDDPVTRHLPWFEIQNRYPEAPPIVVRHLLTHTSGLPREAAFPYWTDGNFPTREQLRQALPEQEAALPTETKWKYSNLALSLAGEIVAAVSGQPYTDYVRERILEPLGMQDTLVRSPDPDHPRLAVGYNRRLPDGSRGVSPFTDAQGITPAANMTTCVTDLARFASLQFRADTADGAEVLQGSTLHEMQQVHWLESNWEAGWGLGFRVERNQGKTYVRHGGALRGYRTELKLCPSDKIAAIVLTNADDGDPIAVAEKAFQWLAPALLEAAAAPAEARETDPGWQAYLGRYRSPWGDLQVLILDGELVALDPSQPDPLEGVSKLIPVAEHVFHIETENGFGNHGEHARFEMDAAGRVGRLQFGRNYSEPIAEW